MRDQRLLQSGFVARHAAFVPHQFSEFAMKRSDCSLALGFQELFRAFGDSRFGFANRRMIGADLLQLGCGQVIADRVGKNEVTIRQSLHQGAGAEPVGAVIGEVGFADRIEPGNRGHQVVIHPESAHRVVNRRIDAHRNVVGIFARDAFVHLEEVAVPFLDALLSRAA